MRKDVCQALANAADGVLIANQDQEIVYWNQAAEAILGYDADEIAGLPCHRIMAGCNDRGRLICRQRCRVAGAAVRGQPVESFDMFVRPKSDGGRWLNISTLTWSTSGSRASAAIVHLFRDVTQKKQRELLLEKVLDAAKTMQNGEPSRSFPPLPAELPAVTLTEREREVLLLLADGLGTRDIAQSLSISTSTARNHIRNVLRKLQVHSRLEAVVRAYREGLVARR